MRGGVAPQLPESGWKIHYAPQLTRWLQAASPPSSWVSAVVEWIDAVQLMGPPAGAILVDTERYLALVPGTKVTIEYLEIAYEFLVLVKEIR